MADEFDAWATYLVASSTLVTVALLLLDDAVWYVRYAVLGAALLLSLVAVREATEQERGEGSEQ